MTLPDDIPSKLGRFDVLRPLGEGGMGKVYLAEDPSMGRQVAIKTIHAAGATSPKLKDRFLREAKAAGALSHPNLVTVHEFGEEEGTLFLVMEYLPGMDLSVFLNGRALTAPEALEVMAQVCDGLAYAHGKGVLHRDVKPHNVRVQRLGAQLHAKLMDFGVARVEGSQLTATGDLVGTFNYMAPEYLRTGEASVRCDLYAVGMMLHEALTGDLPAMAPTLAVGLAEAARRPTLTGVSPHTWEIVEKALAPAPRRFDSAQAMAAALRAAKDPAWPGLEAHELPVLKSLPGDTPAASLPAPTEPLGLKKAGFQPLLQQEPKPESSLRPLWGMLALVVAAFALVAWIFQKPAAKAPVVVFNPEPAPSTPMQGPQAPRVLDPAPSQGSARESGPAQPSQGPETQGESRRDPPPPPPTRDARPEPAEPSRALRTLLAVQDHAKDRPRDVLEAAQDVLREDPRNAMAHALRFAGLYWTGRTGDLGGALDEAQRQQVDGREFGRNACIREMMDAERSARRIPREVIERLHGYLPRPPGEPGARPEGPR